MSTDVKKESTATGKPPAKLPFKEKLGYGFGIWGDTMGNTLFYSFYSYFMTNIAMVLPITTGIISMVGVFWDAITDPIVAYLNGKRPLSKQASLMIVGCVPYIAALIATFTVPGGLSGVALTVYYVVAAMVLFLGYTFYCIPYYSLLPQLTSDYTERTNITSVRSYLNTGANIVAAVCPMLMVTYFAGLAGGNERTGWLVTVIILSVLIPISGIVSSVTLTNRIRRNGIQETAKPAAAMSKTNIFKEFTKGVRTIRTNRRSLIAICIFMVSSAMHRTGGAFYITTVCGFPETAVSLVSLVGLCAWLVIIPLGRKITERKDLRSTILVLLGIGIVGRVAFFFIHVNSIAIAIIYYLFCAFSDVSCYTFMYSLGPDGFLLDELVFGYNRSSICHSVSTFGLKISNAIGLFLWSVILQASGYIAGTALQSAATINIMHTCFTLGVAVLGIISWILYYKYPITRKKYNELLKAVEDLRTTGDFDHSVIDGLV